jgi:hypothetical protein
MKKKPPMPTAEMKSESLRPRDSTKKRTKMEVATTWGGARLVKVVKRWGRGEEAGRGRARAGERKSGSEEKGEREKREGPRRRGGTRTERRLGCARHGAKPSRQH